MRMAILGCMLCARALSLSAQTPADVWQTPWEGVPEQYRQWQYPDFQFPATRAAWDAQRVTVRNTLEDLMGHRPPRPAPLPVRTLWVEDRGWYTLEKFEFDNGLDSRVPGLLVIPKERSGPVPAVLAMHGHGSPK